MKMNNLQFIATYIAENIENPEKRTYSNIIQNLMLWKGYPLHRIANIGGQYSTYFRQSHVWVNPVSGRAYRSDGYKGWLWEKEDPNNRKSPFKLTERGLSYVIEKEKN